MPKQHLVVHAAVIAFTLTAAGASAQTTAPQATNDTGPTVAFADDYIIGAKDVLGVIFWRDADMTGDVTVRPDGNVTLPLLGDVKAAGLRPPALAAQIQETATKYLREPNVTVVVRQINSRVVFVQGEVNAAGEYPLTGPRTVMQLLAEAGGLTEFADQGSITILRQQDGKTVPFRFNYKDVSRGQNLHQNIKLEPGDVIVVRD
jgi:polysaccharide export outer membrane protein